ncbi:hypothetical protein Nepgr_000566 [Nepenthes gracilis]|uniref:catalase n=1 Tax=Nepenthes gracilis TaxID=150966 RepID=A0AAD3RVJ0_NEPGR|nr:hypothetical protein Nepgr_000566 [Nepenthes gracilis]
MQDSILLEDYQLVEELANFGRKRIPERVEHARGASARCFLEVMHDVSYITCFDFLRALGFLATNESTNEETFELVGNNFHVFFICNSIMFPNMVYSFMPKPKSHIQDNWRIIDFFSHHPDSLHMFTLLFDDVRFPQDYRHMVDNLCCWICQHIINVCLEESVVPSDPTIIVLLEEKGANDWCKGSFRRGIYTVEMDAMKGKMHSLLKSLGKLSRLYTELKAAVEEKHCSLAYLAGVLTKSAFFHFEPPVGHRRFRDPTARSGRTYHHIPLSAQNVVVFSFGNVAIKDALRLLSPRFALAIEQLNQQLSRLLTPQKNLLDATLILVEESSGHVKWEEPLVEVTWLLQELLKGITEADIYPTNFNVAFVAQIWQLALEIRDLSLSNLITISNGSLTSSEGYASYLVPAAALGNMGYCFMWWKDWSFSYHAHVKAKCGKCILLLHQNVSETLVSTRRGLTKGWRIWIGSWKSRRKCLGNRK